MLDLRVESETYPISADGLQADFARDGRCRSSTSSRRIDDADGSGGVLMLNRDLDGERELVLEWEDVDADTRARLRDADRAGSEGGQHVRGSQPRRTAAARAARGRERG